MLVILNEVKNLIESIGWKTEILPCLPAAGADASDSHDDTVSPGRG